MKIKKKFEHILDKCESLERYEKDLLVTAFLSDEFSKLILVGGAASSWYSRGGYRTMDVDVVITGDVDELESGLRDLGFHRNKVWHHPEADYALDIVTSQTYPQ